MDISGVPSQQIQQQQVQAQQGQAQQIQQQQQVQQQQVQQHAQETQVQKFDFHNQFDYSSRPSYMNKGIFKKDNFPGLNKRVGFGDIIYTMAQAGKPTGACGGSFMAVA